MKKFLNKKIAVAMLSLAVVAFVAPHVAHAGTLIPDWLDTGTSVIGNLLTSFIEVFLLPLAAGILYLAGSILDAAIQFGLHTGYLFNLSPAINLGWVVIRDIANIFFIFILIWISLGTIVNGLRFGTANMLKNVVIAAILINFSLFITKAVVDVSNIFGNWLYTGVEKTLVGSASPGSSPSLSGLIVQRMGLVDLWQGNTKSLSDPTQSFTGRMLRLTVTLIAIYIFFYAAVLFLARSIELLFLLVFSPIGFMGKVLPQVDDYAKEWRKELTSTALFPIVFLIMLYISLQFINSVDMLAKTGTLASVTGTGSAEPLGGSSFTIAMYFQYFLIIFLLHATLKISKKYAGEMGEKLGGMAETLGKVAVGIAGGGVGLLGKFAIGGAAARLAGNTGLTAAVAGGGIKGLIAGGVQERLGKISDYHFDVRAGTGVGLKPGKGYKSMMEESSKRQVKAMGELAARPEETKAAMVELKDAEIAAYASHKEFGGVYRDKQVALDELDEEIKEKVANNSFKNAEERSAAFNRRDELRKDLGKIKSTIEGDKEFKLGGEIFTAQKKKLEEKQEELAKTVDAAQRQEIQGKIDAIKAAMRQEEAAQKAETGIGVELSKMITGEFKADDKAFLGKETTEFIANTIVGNILRVPTAGGYFAGKYVKDNKGIAGKMREAAVKAKDKKQANIIDLLKKELGGEEGGDKKPEAGKEEKKPSGPDKK